MSKKYGVFISYSHEDQEYVAPIVKIITAMRKDLVFLDTTSIAAGKLWEPQLEQALTEAGMVVVFWCRHSAASSYVEKEYRFAVKNKKDILPLLLDETAVPKPLAAYQWIDLKHIILHRKFEVYRSPTKRNYPEFDESTGLPVDHELTWAYEQYKHSKEEAAKAVAQSLADELNRRIPPAYTD